MVFDRPIAIQAPSRALRVLLAVAAVTSLAGVTVTARAGNEQETKDVAGISVEWARLWSAKNLDGVIALYAEDAVFLPSTGTRIEGRDAIRDLFKGALATHNPSISVRSTRSEVVGDLAYDIGEYRETVTSGVAPTTGRGSYLVVLRRDKTRRWLIVSHMWTDEPAGSR